MTLPELMVALAISGLALAGLMTTFTTLAREQRRNLADTVLQREAAMFQDSLAATLRFLSASESVAFGSPVAPDMPLYRRLVVARGPAPAYPREEIYFDPLTFQLLHDTNRNMSGPDLPIWPAEVGARLRQVHFFPAMKSSGVTDGSVINVFFEMDDDGFSGRKRPDGTVRTNTLRRTFAVKLRNP